MKKYSFNSVDYRKKRYAFSSYQHPRTTHTYFFEAALKRVYIAQNKRYSFLSTKQHKRYHFESQGARNATYHFEAMLKRLITGNHKQYHFIGKKPHKQYHFGARFSKKRKQYHFESTFNAVFEANVIRPDITSSREITQAQVIECETPERQCDVIDAQVIRSSKLTTVDDVLSAEIAQQEHAHVEDLVFGVVRSTQCAFTIRDNTYEAICAKITRYNVPSNVYKAEMLRSEFIAQLDDIYNAQKNTTNDFYSMIDDVKMAHAPYTFDTYKFSTTHSAFNNRENDAYSLIDSTYLAAFNSSNDKYKQKESVRVGELAYTDSYDTANAGNAVILLVSEKAMQDTYTITEINDTKMDHLNASYVQKESVYETIVQRYDNVFEMAENASIHLLDRFGTIEYLYDASNMKMESAFVSEKLIMQDAGIRDKSGLSLIVEDTIFDAVAKENTQLLDKTKEAVYGAEVIENESALTKEFIFEAMNDVAKIFVPSLLDANIDYENISVVPLIDTNIDYEIPTTQNIIDVDIDYEMFIRKEDIVSTEVNDLTMLKPQLLTYKALLSLCENILTRDPVIDSAEDHENIKVIPVLDADVDYENILVNPVLDVNIDYEPIRITPVIDINIDFEPIEAIPIIDVNIDYENISVVPLIDTNIDYEDIEVTPLLDVNIDHEPIQVKPVIDVNIDYESMEDTPILSSNIDFESILIAPTLDAFVDKETFEYVGTFETDVIYVDPFGTPIKKSKKPMWLHQNRPRWAARYFTQVRR